MFDAIGNLPLHPLVLHAVVIGIPLALLLAILFALPRTRSQARWPLAVVAVGSSAATFVARQSGQALQQSLGIAPGDPVGDLISRHAHLANQLAVITVVLAVVSVVATVVVGRVGGTAQHPGQPGRDRALLALLLVAAVIAGVWVYRVGDVGSRAVWNPAGTVQYSSAAR